MFIRCLVHVVGPCVPRGALVLLTAAVLCVAPRTGWAQGQPFFAIDMTLGPSLSRGGGGRFHDPDGFSFDATMVMRFRERVGHGPVAGFAWNRSGRFGEDLSCRILDDGSCSRQYPVQRSRAALVGWEWLDRTGFAMRAFLAPTWSGTRDDSTARTRLHLRADIATPSFGPLSIVASVRGGSHVSGPRGLTIVSGGLGLRIR